MTYTYIETRKAVKAMIAEIGLDNLLGKHLLTLIEKGYDSRNIHCAINYFRFSPQAQKFRDSL